VAVLGRKIWGHGPVASKYPPGIEARGPKAVMGFLERGSKPRPQTHFGRIYSQENATVDTTCIMCPLPGCEVGGRAKLGGDCAPALA